MVMLKKAGDRPVFFIFFWVPRAAAGVFEGTIFRKSLAGEAAAAKGAAAVWKGAFQSQRHVKAGYLIAGPEGRSGGFDDLGSNHTTVKVNGHVLEGYIGSA